MCVSLLEDTLRSSQFSGCGGHLVVDSVEVGKDCGLAGFM
jgi:hypothetical protein